MNTTVLFAELLVCGLQTSIWISLVAMAIFGSDKFLSLTTTDSVGFGVVFLAWAYTFGVVFDRLWDACLKPVDRKIRDKIISDPTEVHRLRRQIFSADSSIPGFVDYIRTRMRIARATMCNVILITVSGLLLIMLNTGLVWDRKYTAIVVFGTLLSVLALIAYKNLTRNYYKTLQNLTEHNLSSTNHETSATDHTESKALSKEEISRKSIKSQ